MKSFIIRLIFLLICTAFDAFAAWLLWNLVSPDHQIKWIQAFVICLVFQQLLFTGVVRQSLEASLKGLRK